MFRENAHRLSICFHGNDHTEAELASTDTALLNRVLGIAEERMKVHEQVTGLHCDRVMVFPQDELFRRGHGGSQIPKLPCCEFEPHPVGKPVPLRIADLAQPAVLRYGGFPLFIRNFMKDTQSQDIAFNLFFGRPTLIGEHHDIFRHPRSLLEVVQKINSIATWNILVESREMPWTTQLLSGERPDGTVEVRPYSRNVLIANDSASVERFSIEWGQAGQCSPVEQVLRDGTLFPGVEFDDAGIRVLAELAPGASQIFSVVYRNGHAALGNLGFGGMPRRFCGGGFPKCETITSARIGMC